MRYGINRIALLLLISAALVQKTSGQDRAFVTIETNYPEAVVYADSIRIGSVFGEVVGLPTSVQTMKLIPPEVDSWSVSPVSQRVDLRAGDTLALTLDFPYHYRIESIPFDASVHIEKGDGRKRLGSTPLLYSVEQPLEGKLLIERPGYVAERIDPGSAIWNRHVIDLSPSDELDPTAAQVQWKPPKKHRAWIDYAALGTALVAGAVAVHYKFKADDLYAQYEDTANPALRDDIKAHDLRSGIAFGVMQAGIGLFAIRLVLK